MSYIVSSNSNQPSKRISLPSGKTLTFFIGAIAVGGFWLFFRDTLSLEALAEQQSNLKAFQAKYPVAIFAVAFLLYVAITGLSLPGAAALTLCYAWFFGFWPAMLVVSFASTSGATLAFLSSRFLLRDTVRARYGDSVGSIEKRIENEGAFYLFTLRLIPAVPFFVINLAMGLTPIKVRTYWWVSQLGMLPGTAAYIFAGSRVPDLETLAEEGVGAVFSTGQFLQLVTAFAILGLLPITIKYVLAAIQRGKTNAVEGEGA
ncbi:MAG: TVP38/TMEM64 family protein [Planctomycetota bacterium]